MSVSDAALVMPTAAKFVMPGEWAPHDRCWMSWPCRPDTWPDAVAFDAAKVAYAEVARAISRFEPVTMVCDLADAAEASLACGAGIEILSLPISDSWMRDTGPSFVLDGQGGIAGVDWDFNAWGRNYDDFAKDQAVAGLILEKLGIRQIKAPLVMEGGSFHVDGEGTLVTTEQCLLNKNRNPHLSREEIEAQLRQNLGVETIIWLGQGYQDDETDGHIDEIAAFARPGVLLVAATDDPSDGNFAVFKDNLDRLNEARDAKGREIEVVPLRQARRRDENGVRLTLSYTNFYMANGGIVMPAFEDPADDEAFRTMRKVFPDYEIVQVRALDIVRGGGGIHCITQQQPSAFPAA